MQILGKLRPLVVDLTILVITLVPAVRLFSNFHRRIILKSSKDFCEKFQNFENFWKTQAISVQFDYFGHNFRSCSPILLKFSQNDYFGKFSEFFVKIFKILKFFGKLRPLAFDLTILVITLVPAVRFFSKIHRMIIFESSKFLAKKL